MGDQGDAQAPLLGEQLRVLRFGTLPLEMRPEGELLVLRTGTTNRAFAEAKLQLMSRLPVRILGAVLNGTPQTQTYRYYSYLPEYGVQEEDSSDHTPMLATRN